MSVNPDPRGWQHCISQTLSISPSYQHLDACMQRDTALMAQRSWVDSDQPNLILFMATVNRLVLEEPTCELAQFYPLLSAHPRPLTEMYPVFRAFCLSHATQIRALLQDARLQTSEPGRCTALLPAFERVSLMGGRQPLSLIEIGSSAGLLLNWQHYGYHYGQIIAGNLSSPVQLHCELRCDHRLPPLPVVLPLVASCQGIERFPVAVTDERDERWLHACVWIDAVERHRRLAAALHVARQFPTRIHTGDAVNVLPVLLEQVPAQTTVCVFHSFALNQGPNAIKEQIEQHLLEFSRKQIVYRVSFEVEPPHRPLPWLELFAYRRGEVYRYEHLATCALHGGSMQWHAVD